MKAKGESGREYQDSDISDKDLYNLMKEDVLWSVGSVIEQVFPVRHPTSPHFRRFRASAYQKVVDERKPRSHAHKKCIEFMLRNLEERGVRITTPTFENGKRDANGQVLLKVAKGVYNWWSDIKGTRIPVGYGRYIQPDLCGRLASGDAFAPSLKFPNLIVEVIDTHYPEEGTLFELLKLSTMNHVVALHFIRAPSFSSYWSQVDTPTSGLATIRVVHLLVDGNLVVNGTPEKNAPPTDRASFSAWYAGRAKSLLDEALVRKSSPPPSAPPSKGLR